MKKQLDSSLVISREADPEQLVFGAFEEVLEKKDELELPIKEFTPATGFLKRKGVALLAVLEDVTSGIQEKVLIRIMGVNDWCHLRAGSSQGYGEDPEKKLDFTTWHSKHIHTIDTTYCKTLDQVFRKVVHCLKTALHHFMRKLQKSAMKKNPRADNVARRLKKERYRQERSRLPRMCMAH